MEALVAVGLASNVLQFVDFATKLVSKAKELRQDAVSSDHKDYDAIAAHLQVLARKVGTSAHSIAQSSATASPEEKALQPVADGCCELARKLSKRLNDLDLLSAQSGSLLRRGKAAWRWVWNKKEIEEIAERLHYFGSQLSLHMTYQVRQNQLEQRTWQSSKDDVQATLARIDDVLLSTEKLKLGIDEKLDRQHEEVLHSFADLSVRNSQLQTQTIEEVSSASRVASEGIHGLGTSFNAMMLKQSEIFESLATVRVENSELHGRVTQVLPQTHDFDSTSLQYLLKSMLDEYQEKSIMEIRKEFRGTARSEMENLRTQALQALNEMQSGRQTRHPKAETTPEPAVKPSSPYASEPIQNAMGAETAPLKLGEHGRQKKNDISIVYTKRRWIDTRIGTFWFRIRDKVVFDSVKPPVSVYELTVHFTPSPRWCSKSFSVAYQKVADARGGPKFGLQLESYRVLDNDHEVWKAIREHDVDSVRTMLAERVISPYDHRHDGWALLSHATLFGNLDMVKALVHSGADINAVDE
ncbi:hypothetical protein F4818DRAFT_9308 [Hypoxylon cercidicola]|nr:hypothetical protein F4818DRAFT_9308 [Hypoxylon cercidicola]